MPTQFEPKPHWKPLPELGEEYSTEPWYKRLSLFIKRRLVMPIIQNSPIEIVSLEEGLEALKGLDADIEEKHREITNLMKCRIRDLTDALSLAINYLKARGVDIPLLENVLNGGKILNFGCDPEPALAEYFSMLAQVTGLFPENMEDDGSGKPGWTPLSIHIVHEARKLLQRGGGGISS
jgi:hypothetical protein